MSDKKTPSETLPIDDGSVSECGRYAHMPTHRMLVGGLLVECRHVVVRLHIGDNMRELSTVEASISHVV